MPAFAGLFPTAIRADGAGRGLGSIVPATVGILSTHMHLCDAMALCAICGYAAAFCAALMLPEQQGLDLRTMAAEPSANETERAVPQSGSGRAEIIRMERAKP